MGDCTSPSERAPIKSCNKPCGVDSFTFGDFGTYEVVFVPDGKEVESAVTVYERREYHLKKVK